MFIINPPYTLLGAMKEALPYLCEALGQDDGARFAIEHRDS
jgi:23S rRNA (adenine2030-N6)-methyltransferase